MKANAPYVKKYENGILVNPITKYNPYLFPEKIINRTFKNGFWQKARNKFFLGKNVIKAY